MTNKQMDKNELVDIVDDMQGIMRSDELLLAIVKAMTSKDLQETLEYINRCYDLDIKELQQNRKQRVAVNGCLFIYLKKLLTKL